MNPIIQITDLSAAYNGKTVLSHVNLTVHEQDFLGITFLQPPSYSEPRACLT